MQNISLIPHGMFFSKKGSFSYAKLKDCLMGSIGIVYISRKKGKIRIFDTFDWRLYKKGFILYEVNHSVVFRHISSGKETVYDAENTVSELPRDLLKCIKDTEFLNTLSSILFPRALLVIADLSLDARLYRLENTDEKTIAYLEAERGRPDKNSSVLVSINPLRGYETHLKAVKHCLSDLGFSLFTKNKTLSFIEFLRLTPPGLESRNAPVLKPDMTVKQAVAYIVSEFIKEMQKNEFGIKEDIDIEFLHDFRIAVRKIRSVVSLVKGAFAADDQTMIQHDFKVIGSKTRDLRDLDVCLFREKEYNNLIPENLRTALLPFFNSLRERREKCCKELVFYLAQNSYKESIGKWQEIFSTADVPSLKDGKNSSDPIIETAVKVVKKRYDHLAALNREMTENTPDQVLHAVRIDCKKLRYSLEFFESLFKPKTVKKINSRLKILQDLLGNFNDSSVQINTLEKYLAALDSEAEDSLQQAAAVGGIITRLEERKEELRERFLIVYQDLIGGKISDLFPEIGGF